MYKKDVYTTLSLILQLGISILVPIFLLTILGLFLKSKFNFDILILLIILGVLAGFRNVVVILKNYLKMMDKGEGDSEIALKMKKIL